jgi:cobalt-zinc-cadmium efflux system outer membrane protein
MMGRRQGSLVALLTAAASFGCAAWRSPWPEGANLPPAPSPVLNPPPPPASLPDPPRRPLATGDGPLSTLTLATVLESAERHFPLLYAAEQERAIAAGQRLAAEGQFDLALKGRGLEQGGTFSNARFDVGVEQPLAFGGVTVFSGWRLGQGNFPIYYGDRKTGDGGEFRTGVQVPLLQNRDIDPRRVRVSAAQIAEQLADPTILRARLDCFRASAAAYWSWTAAGAQVLIAQDVLKLARDRQKLVDEQRRQNLVGEATPSLNRRLIASREEQLLAAERLFQQAAIRLSLFHRDANGDPLVPTQDQLPPAFIDTNPSPPDGSRLPQDVVAAIANRPELARFGLLKRRAGLDLQLAENQCDPTVNLVAAVAQDVGSAKKTFIGEGPFDTDRTTAEIGVTVDVPLQRRDARGRIAAARGQLTQLLAQESYARDEITAQVQDAASELDRTFQRLTAARTELREALRVRDLELESFKAGRISLIDLNIQELAAAEAQAKVVGLLAAYFRAEAEFAAAVGLDPSTTGRGNPPSR